MVLVSFINGKRDWRAGVTGLSLEVNLHSFSASGMMSFLMVFFVALASAAFVSSLSSNMYQSYALAGGCGMNAGEERR